ncbi:MAG TPA: hypothetical protein DGU45_06935 [Planctomycetes bacterium]|nr:hypothetical protein [Planctomycetota bacterium]
MTVMPLAVIHATSSQQRELPQPSRGSLLPRIVIVRQKKSDFKFLSSRFTESVRFSLSCVNDRIPRNLTELQRTS